MPSPPPPNVARAVSPAETVGAVPRSVPALTGIRGVAALWVVLFHLWSRGGSPAMAGVPGVAAILRDGWVGVDLFFVLSGFILMHTHWRDFADSPTGSAPPFFRARFLRVYPLSAIVLLLIAAAVVTDPVYAAYVRSLAPGNLSAVAFVKTLTLSTAWLLPGQGAWNEPIWSLSAEIVGYAAFPLGAWLLARVRTAVRSLLLVTAAMTVLVLYLAELRYLGLNLIAGPSALVRMGTEFGAGMALYRLRQHLPRLSRGHARLLLATGASGVLVLNYVPLGAAFMPLAFLLLLLGLSVPSGSVVERVLAHPAAMVLGRLSFPLYLIHLDVLLWFEAHFGAVQATTARSLAVATAVLGVSLIAAAVLHRQVERPLAALAHRRSA